MNKLCQDSLAILLICSDLGLSMEMRKRYKPYTLAQWNRLADKILNSSLQKPSSLLGCDNEVLKKELLLSGEEFERLEFLLGRGGNLAIEIEQLESKGIYITTRAEGNYPQRLKTILKKQSPPIIFYSGNLSIANRDGVGIVGSRDIDDDGILFTKKVSNKLSKEGYTIISGGAKGVDSIAENTTLDEKGYVVSIVSNSLSNKIKEKNIRNSILEDKLLVLSTVNPNARFSVYSAMDRNKYIYALGQYVVAVSSKENGGGTWTGAVENLKKGWVPLFVRSGKDIPSGNKKLLELGGKPINIDNIDDTNISMRDFLVGSIEGNHIRKNYEQINMYNIHTEMEDGISKVMEQNEEQEKQEESVDLYEIVLPYIKKMLSEPKNQNELCELLNINKSQLGIWINRAIEEKQILKLQKPVRYVISSEDK